MGKMKCATVKAAIEKFFKSRGDRDTSEEEKAGLAKEYDEALNHIRRISSGRSRVLCHGCHCHLENQKKKHYGG
jgi:hypothetical protein